MSIFSFIFRQSKVFKQKEKKIRMLMEMPRFAPGNINIMDWDLDFLDGPALGSCIDILVNKRWNDFVADNDRPVILDCGANIGISVLNYKRQFPLARITAFEADPDIMHVLKRNLHKNLADDVTVIDAAVWTKNGAVSFYCEGADGSRIIPDNSNSAKQVTVPSVDLAEYITGPIDLIKMDIEGAEFKVISHLGSKLALVKAMVIECHIANDRIEELSSLLGELANAKFKVAVNSYGAWRDLIHNPDKLPDEFDQYMLVAAWR